ncbi:MAG TPA: hypothetical protein VMG32_07530 [Anaeromyxobacteraceae bacterium]|nr:hypothetical protein [Anaeromyxobacteraceae bacterium]
MLRLAFAFALARALAASEPAEPGVAAPTPPAGLELRTLDTGQAAAALCSALEPTDRLLYKGDVVARARAEAEHDTVREAALAGSYEVRVPGARLRFAPYDPEEGLLALSERTYLAGAEGSLGLWALHDAGLPVRADPPVAERIVRAAEHRALVLVLVFTLPDDAEEAVCTNVAGSRHFGLGVEPYRWEYRVGGRALARGGEGGDRPLLTAAEGARPRVRVAEAEGPRAADLKAAVEGQSHELASCYEQALRKNPGLDGAYVAEVDVAEGGERQVRPAIDSLQDEAMTACVTAVLARADLKGGPGRATIPIHFDLEPPEGAP